MSEKLSEAPEEKDEFGFKFNVGDVVYHICDNDRIYRFLICVKMLTADKEGVGRSYICKPLDGAAGLFVAFTGKTLNLQEWELMK